MLGGLAACSRAEKAEDLISRLGPIDRTLGDRAPAEFSGDQNERPHRILWARDAYLATKRVEPGEEEVPLAIVGGGMSGLFSAYQFRDQKPVILEQAARFGGNAKGQSWRGLDYSIGSAYIDTPHAGSPMAQYYQELGLAEITVPRNTIDPVAVGGKVYADFWSGEADLTNRKAYERLATFLTELAREKHEPFPFIPALTEGHKRSLLKYDRENLHTCLTRVVGGKLPAQLEAAIEHYSFSTYACSATEISAAAALNFLAQEVEPIRVCSGGNARIGERLMERLLASGVPTQNFRAGAIVVRVTVEGNRGVRILYEDKEGKLRALRAKAAILACPKFVVAKLLDGIEPERVAAIRKLRYRAYVVANLLVNQRAAGKFYDLFLVGDGKVDVGNIRATQDRQNATDYVLANFAAPERLKDAKFSVLTFYRAFPYDGARAELFPPDAFARWKARFEKQIREEILPLAQVPESSIVDLRLTRWGHALPLAAQGIYSDGTVDALRKPFQGKVFFVEQDNWAYPATQTGATDVALMRAEIARALGLA